jgi:hypothetical protein
VNRLYFGDNLEWLRYRREFPDASVDLVYLDPPFNSNADYNVLFREPSVAVSDSARVEADHPLDASWFKRSGLSLRVRCSFPPSPQPTANNRSGIA